jgi:hypothetical protein
VSHVVQSPLPLQLSVPVHAAYLIHRSINFASHPAYTPCFTIVSSLLVTHDCQIQDLSQQLRLLLKEQGRKSRATFVDSHGHLVSTPSATSSAVVAVSPMVQRSGAQLLPPIRFQDDVDASVALDPDDVISQHLVGFADIVELQTRNVQLLRVVRQLSKQRSDDDGSQRAPDADASTAAELKVVKSSAPCMRHEMVYPCVSLYIYLCIYLSITHTYYYYFLVVVVLPLLLLVHSIVCFRRWSSPTLSRLRYHSCRPNALRE